MDVDDGVGEVTVEFLGLLLGKGTSSNYCFEFVSLGRELPCPLEYAPSKAWSMLTASLALVSKYGISPFDWQNVKARFEDIILLFSSTSILFPSTTCHWLISPLGPIPHSFPGTHKWEAFRVSRASLDEELVPPAIQCLKALRVIDVVDQNAAVSSSVECDAKRLKPFLSGSVP